MRPVKHHAGSYILNLVRVGLASYVILLAALAGIQVWRVKNFELYDFGAFLIATGSILAFSGIFVFFSNALWQSQVRRFVAPHSRTAPTRDVWSHYLLSGSIACLLIAATGLSLIWILTSNGIRQAMPGAVPTIGSAKLQLQEFEPYAHEWNPDAYLIELSLVISDEAPSYRMNAIYGSASWNSLEIQLLQDGTIELQRGFRGGHPADAIHDTDWPVDSQEALRIFGAVEGVSSCLMTPYHSSGLFPEYRLELARWEFSDDKRVVWILYTHDCIGVMEPLFIDASTGELLDIHQ